MLISPTEPASFRAVGEVSSLPEKYGVDFLFAKNGKWWGVQRKEHADFVSSVQDGRLAKELAQMQQLSQGMLLLEGAGKWTNDGELMGWGAAWTRKQEHAYLWTVRSRGVWVDRTENAVDTASRLRAFEDWASKGTHRSSHTRPGPTSSWGRATSRDWAVHLLCGFEGVGPEIAARILDAFGVPFAWKVTREELMQVEGIGKKRADKLIAALQIGG